jgi:ABC-type antimicrobial peptide transport system permease subunit
VGAAIGCVLGGLGVGYLGHVGFEWNMASDTSEIVALLGGRVYPKIGMDVVLQRGLMITIIAALASLYPARQASKREPAEALHYV